MQAVSKYVKIIFISFLAFSVIGCATSKPQKTAMQLQAFQAKEFEASVKTAFASTVSVFQDYGYIIAEADLDTGLITAKSPTEGGFVLFVGNKMSHVRASAFVEPRSKGVTKIRLNFVTSVETSSGYGMKSHDEDPIEDPKYYQEVFSKIQQAIFVRTNI